jgi:hypothetical protein
MKTIKKRIEDIEERLDQKLSPKNTDVYALMLDGSENYLYSYPDKLPGKMVVVVGGGFNPPTQTPR